MALTASKIMARVWRELGHLTEVTATGGSTTTIIDTVDVAQKFTSDDMLIGGTAIVLYDAGGAGAAPEGEFVRINDYVALTATFTVATLSAAVGAGDRIGLARPTIARQAMLQAVNDALANLGTISLVDTSLTTAAAQTEYALPVGLKIKRLVDVLLQGYLNDSNDNRYTSIMSQVQYVPAAPGSTGLLILPQFISGYTIKIVYEGVHPALTLFSSVISETIQEELIVAATKEKALGNLIAKKGASAAGALREEYNKAALALDKQKAEKPIFRSKPKAKWFVA